MSPVTEYRVHDITASVRLPTGERLSREYARDICRGYSALLNLRSSTCFSGLNYSAMIPGDLLNHNDDGNLPPRYVEAMQGLLCLNTKDLTSTMPTRGANLVVARIRNAEEVTIPLRRYLSSCRLLNESWHWPVSPPSMWAPGVYLLLVEGVTIVIAGRSTTTSQAPPNVRSTKAVCQRLTKCPHLPPTPN